VFVPVCVCVCVCRFEGTSVGLRAHVHELCFLCAPHPYRHTYTDGCRCLVSPVRVGMNGLGPGVFVASPGYGFVPRALR
jgi:hypothetical protein